MVRRYFGTDGIRGRANKVITPELALKVGQAAGLLFKNGEHRHRVLIGKDTRLSGYMIETALVAGFTSVGMDVLLTGPIPTPAVGMLARSMRADLGVMISASHNPYADNGIKLFGPDGYKLSDQVESEIEALLDSDLSKHLAKSDDLGRAKRIDGVQDRYIEFAKLTLPRAIDLSGLRVVIDCANGAAYKVAPGALWELGADVISIGVDPDGMNINKDCGSTDLGAITRKVREMRADIGIALDGDADRVMIVDERGHAVDGDQLLAVIAESWKEDGRLQRPGVVATVMSNLGLERHLAGLGIELVRTSSMPCPCRKRSRPRLDITVATIPPPARRPRSSQVSAMTAMSWSPSITRPRSSVMSTRSASPSSAMPISARTSLTLRARSSGAVEPQSLLMFRPSGSTPSFTTSAPSSHSASGATL